MPRIPSSHFNKMPPSPLPPSGGEVDTWDGLRDTAERAPTITPEASDALIGVVDKWIGRGAMYNSLDRILGNDNTPEVSEERFRNTHLKENGSFSQRFTDRLREKVFFDDEFDDVDYELVCEAAADMIRVASGGVEGVNAAAVGLNVFRDLQLTLPMLKRAVEMCPREASHVIAEMVSKKHSEIFDTDKGKELVIQVLQHVAETPATQWRMLAMKDEMVAHDVYALYGDVNNEDDDVGREAIKSIVTKVPDLEKLLFGLRKREYERSIGATESKEGVKRLNGQMVEGARDLIASAAIPHIIKASKSYNLSEEYWHPLILLDNIVTYERQDSLLMYGRDKETRQLNSRYFSSTKAYIANMLEFEDVARFTQKGLGDFAYSTQSLNNMRDILDNPARYAADGIVVKLYPRLDHNGSFSPPVGSRYEEKIDPGELAIRIGCFSDVYDAAKLLDELQLPIRGLVIGGHGDRDGIWFGENYRYSRDGKGNDEIDALIRRVRKDGVIFLRSCSSGVQFDTVSSSEQAIDPAEVKRESSAEVVARKHGREVVAYAGRGNDWRLRLNTYYMQYVDGDGDWSDVGARKEGYIKVEPGHRMSLADEYTTKSTLVADGIVDIKALKKERKHGN